jgi:glycosyltransferase involved in cell wall biosynthesis
MATKKSSKIPKVALVHDYLREYGGAERVLEAFHQLYPEAPVYVAFSDPQAMGRHWQKFADWNIKKTWLSQVPGIKKFFSPLRIFAPSAFSSLDLSEFDLVISSTNAYMAKSVLVPNGKHICYCHTPPRSLYGYSTMSDWKKRWWIRLPGELINHVMRVYDFKTAQKVDIFIANSRETAARIKKYYRRESKVIFPPVNVPSTLPKVFKDYPKTPALTSASKSNQNGKFSQDDFYFLYVNRLAFAKHPEVAVEACTKLCLPLKVVGAGPMLAQLKAMAGPTIEFLGSVSDSELSNLYLGAKALLYPVEDEDFGMVPIEAMGYGVPVVAHASGGPLETVVDSKTGIFFNQLSVSGLIKAIRQLESITFDRNIIHQTAKKYSQEFFYKKIKELEAKV